MPMSKAGRKIMSNLKDQYGSEKGEEVFYAMENKNKIPGMKGGYAEGGMAKKKKKKGYAKGGMVKTGHADRKGGMFYKSESPRGYK